jgi:hypothetical protein
MAAIEIFSVLSMFALAIGWALDRWIHADRFRASRMAPDAHRSRAPHRWFPRWLPPRLFWSFSPPWSD